MDISLFDTHADTPYEMYKMREGIVTNSLHVSLDKVKMYKKYCQCMAIWSDKSLSNDDAFSQFKRIHNDFKSKIEKAEDAVLCQNYSEIESAFANGKRAFILTVEDARLLNGDIKRLEFLFDSGVKILTFQWQGETCIGGGFDTDSCLSAFGKDVANECARKNIIPDISHANERTSRDILEAMAKHGKPVIATHSNSYTVCPHKRNMSDGLYDALVSVGGIVGISLAPQHLRLDAKANVEDIFKHIDHYAERQGIDHICLGCDFDGIETTPSDITNVSQLTVLYDCMVKHGYTKNDIGSVFYNNARRFFSQNLL